MTSKGEHMTIRRLTDPGRFRITWANGRRFYIDREPGCDIAEPMTEKQKVPNCTSIAKTVGSDAFFKKVGDAKVPLDALRVADYAIDAWDRLADMPADERRISMAMSAGRDLNRAADRGTAVHALIESLLRGEQPLLLEADAEPYEPIAAKVAADFAPLLTHMEVVGFSRLHGYGGTFDAIGLHDGRNILLDWKSRGPDSKHGCYEKEVAQLGLGQLCDYWFDLDADGALVRRPMPTFTEMLVVSIRPDSYEVYPLDPAKAVEVAHDALAIHTTKSRAGSVARQAVGTPVPSVSHFAGTDSIPPADVSDEPLSEGPGTATTPPPAAAPTKAQAVAMCAPPGHRKAATPAPTTLAGCTEALYGKVTEPDSNAAWIAERYDALLKHADIPPAAVQRGWPDGLPGPKEAATMNTHQRQLAADALTRLEDEYGVPFADPDPELPEHQPRQPIPAAQPAPLDPLPAPFEDGRKVDAESADALRRRLTDELTDAQRDRIRGWLDEGAAARRPWNMGHPPVLLRRFEVSRAAVELALHTTSDEQAHALIAVEIGDDAAQRHPVGALLGTLSAGEAASLADLARAHNHNHMKGTTP